MLTTPNIIENEDVFPGEKWFVYWKTSASLWEVKLREFAMGQEVYVPINWAKHCEHPDQYDFGTIKPETDLLKLYQLASDLSIKVNFVFFAGPLPNVSNGGVPSFLAKTNSESKTGIKVFALDRNDKVNKIFSFYNPRVYQYYSKFLDAFHHFIIKSGIDAEVIGGRAYYLEEYKAYSYFEDYSADYINGFHKYLNQMESEKENFISSLKLDKSLESKVKEEYQILIQGLYEQVVQSKFEARFLGFVNYLFLGAGLKENIERSLTKFRGHYFESLFHSLTNGFIPSTVLLSEKEKDECLNQALKKLVNQNFINSYFEESPYENENSLFVPYSNFKIQGTLEDLESLGLKRVLDDSYGWSYDFRGILQECDSEYHFFFEDQMTLNEYQNILKLFMNGKTVFLNESTFSADLLRKFSVFVAENNLKTEKIRLGVLLQTISLGEGKIFLFKKSELLNLSKSKKEEFWNKVFLVLNIRHPVVKSDEYIYYLWQRRFSSSHELQFEEVRRLNIFNPSNYKRKIKVLAHQNFAFLKTIDERLSHTKSSEKSIEIELKPGGSLSLDFGLYQ